MAQFTPSKKTIRDFNGGDEYLNKIDVVQADTINNLVEGLLYAQENGGSGGGNYVTIDTTQTITGAKTFKGLVRFDYDNIGFVGVNVGKLLGQPAVSVTDKNGYVGTYFRNDKIEYEYDEDTFANLLFPKASGTLVVDTDLLGYMTTNTKQDVSGDKTFNGNVTFGDFNTRGFGVNPNGIGFTVYVDGFGYPVNFQERAGTIAIDEDIPTWARTESKPEYSWEEINNKPTDLANTSYVDTKVANIDDFLKKTGGTVGNIIVEDNYSAEIIITDKNSTNRVIVESAIPDITMYTSFSGNKDSQVSYGIGHIYWSDKPSQEGKIYSLLFPTKSGQLALVSDVEEMIKNAGTGSGSTGGGNGVENISVRLYFPESVRIPCQVWVSEEAQFQNASIEIPYGIVLQTMTFSIESGTISSPDLTGNLNMKLLRHILNGRMIPAIVWQGGSAASPNFIKITIDNVNYANICINGFFLTADDSRIGIGCSVSSFTFGSIPAQSCALPCEEGLQCQRYIDGTILSISEQDTSYSAIFIRAKEVM